jgi:lipopolysaccharide export system ATP-binding protein
VFNQPIFLKKNKAKMESLIAEFSLNIRTNRGDLLSGGERRRTESDV